MIFCNGLYFALRSEIEHGQLLLNPCQIELIENEGERVYLRIYQRIGPGSFKGGKMKQKVVIHHANTDCPE